jgi:hypothetical protein
MRGAGYLCLCLQAAIQDAVQDGHRTLEAARAGDEEMLEIKAGEARGKGGLDVFPAIDLWC